MQPFFTYYGGKYRVAPHYPKPQYRTIIEPFAGAAGYAIRYAQYDVILVEKNPLVAALWRYLIRVSMDEILSLPDILEGQTVDDLNVPQEAKWLIGFWLNKGSAQPCKTPSKWMREQEGASFWWGEHVRTRIATQVNLIRHWTLIEGSYEDAPDVQATWFIDPPYQLAGKHYRCSSDDIDFTHLGEWCKSRRGQVIVCENEGADWLPFEPFMHIKSTPGTRGKGTSAEAIWYQTDVVEETLF